MTGGIAEHEVCADAADFRAVEHQTEVIGSDVFASGFEAMIGGGAEADIAAVAANLDTMFQFFAEMT